ncbi:MAG: methionyl-tRNA formyltransferase [Actinomycetes bacterium]
MRVVFAGSPPAALPSLNALVTSDHDVVAVVTRPDAPAGRGRQLTPSAVKSRAQALGLDVLAPAKAGDADFLDALRSVAPDCCAVVAYGALLPEPTLAIPEHGWVNLHFSLLPAWRGAAPVQHAILAGDELTGATTFQIEAGLDTGPVFGMLTTEIGARETAGDLLARLAETGADLLVSTLDAIANGAATPRPQPNDGVSHAPKLTTAHARVDWAAPALRVDRLVRACTPAPGAWTTFRDKRIGLGPVQPLRVDPTGSALAVGQVHADKAAVVVGTGGGLVELGEVRPPGKPAMPAIDWARGLRLTDDDSFA